VVNFKEGPSAEFVRVDDYLQCGVEGCESLRYTSKKAFQKHMKSYHNKKMESVVNDFLSEKDLSGIWDTIAFNDVENNRELSTLTHVLRWEQTVPISKRMESMDYVARVNADENIFQLYGLVDELCVKWSIAAQGLNEAIRRKMVIHTEQTYGWKRVEEKSIKEYSRTLFKLLIFLYRVSSTEQDDIDVPDDLKAAVISLSDSVDETSVSKIVKLIICEELETNYMESRFSMFWFVLLNGCDLETMGFRDGNTISKAMSHLQYCFRAFVGYEISLGYMDCEAEMKILKFLDVSETNVMGFLRVYACQIKGITAGKAPLCRIQTFANHHGRVISIGGNRVGIDDLKSFCLKMVSNAEKLLTSLCRMCEVDFKTVSLPTVIADDLQQLQVNYGLPEVDCLSSLRFRLAQSSKLLLTDENAMKKFMKQSSELLEVIFVLHHVLGGMPSRGTEYIGLMFRSTAHVSRAVFGHDDQLMIAQTYSKTVSACDRGKVVCRFLPPNVSKLVVAALVMVRPVMILIAQKRGVKDSVLEAYRHRMYVLNFYHHPNVVWKEKTACMVFECKMKECVGVPLHLGEYRHVAEYFVTAHIISVEDKFEWFAMQSGHSLKTSRTVYASSDRDCRFVREDEIRMFEITSHQWQNLILGGEIGAAITGSAAAGHTKLDVIHQVVSNVHEIKSWSGVDHYEVTEGDMKLAYVGLKKIIGTHAAFKSTEQAIAMSLIMVCKASGFVVLPTGGGKTWTYAVPALLDTKITVVVLPLVSMAVTYRMIEGHEDSYCTWISGMDASMVPKTCRILLVSSGFVQTLRFQNSMFELCRTDRLKCCVIDEVHMVVTESSYREDLCTLHGLGRLSLPWYLLSGTVPCGSFIDSVKSRLGIESIRLVRAQTCRTDLNWVVKQIPALHTEVEIQHRLFMSKSTNDLLLFYFNSKAEVEKYARLFNSAKFHAGLSHTDKISEMERWRSDSTNCRVMCSTTACAAGMDVLNIRLVIQVGIPYSLISLVQQGGRAGRDGKGGSVLLLLDLDQKCRDSELRAFVETTNCRLQVLSKLFDGRLDACYTTGKIACCDLCRSKCTLDDRTMHVQTASPCDVFEDFDSYLELDGLSTPGVKHSLHALTAEKGKRKISGLTSDATPVRRLKMTTFVSPTIPNVKHVEFSRDIIKEKQSIVSYTRHQPWDDPTKCWLCIVQRKPCKNGGIRSCTLANRCIRCLGEGHDVRNCPFPRHKWNQACFKCQLPSFVSIGDNKENAHDFKHYASKCKYKMECVQVSWYYWRFAQNFVLGFINEEVDDEQFHSWMQMKQHGILNVVRLLVACYDNYGHSNSSLA